MVVCLYLRYVKNECAMTREELIKQCRYYKGEEKCPFERNSNADLWWGGEKMFVDYASDDESFFQGLKDSFEDALASGHCNGVLVDSSIPIEKRVLIFYLDLWHGKWFPYDDFDVINQY